MGHIRRGEIRGERTLVEELDAEESTSHVEVQDDVVDAWDRVLDVPLTHTTRP